VGRSAEREAGRSGGGVGMGRGSRRMAGAREAGSRSGLEKRARTDDDDPVEGEPLLDDVSEEGGEGELIGRFVTSQRAGRFAARCCVSRAACLKAHISISLLYSIKPSRRKAKTDQNIPCNVIHEHTCTSSLFSPRALLFRLRLPNTESLAHVLFGSSLRRTLSLNSWLLDKPPGTGDQEAGNQTCMVEISQFVWALVWTNPCNGMEMEIPSERAQDITDESK